MLRQNDALANRGLDCKFNGGVSLHMLDGGTSLWYDAPQPSNPNAAHAGTVLSTVTHAADASAAATGRAVNFQGTMEDTSADAAGTIQSVRFLDPTGVYWFDASAGQQGPAIAITAAALVGGLVQITAAGHGLANGAQVEIAGHSVAALNGKWQAFNVTANTFQIMSTDAPGVGGTARLTFDFVVDNAVLAAGQDFQVLSGIVAEPV